LGPLPGDTFSFAYGINASGQVVGQSGTPDASGNFVHHAVLWNAGATTPTPTDLGASSGVTTTYALGINDKGVVVGVSGGAVEWAPGATATTPITPLGPLGSTARAINANGQVVGEVETKDTSGNPVAHAVRWDSGTTTPTELSTSSSLAFGINASGAVVGGAEGSGAVEWAPGATATTSPTTLGLLQGGTAGIARAINASGQVVGLSNTKDANGNAVPHAVRWDAGTTTPTDLGTLAGITGTLAGITSTVALGINASGQVVGAAGTSPDGDIFGHAVLWNTGATTPTDLGSLLPAGSGWVLESAYAINDAVPVQIAGVGTINGAEHGFRLTCS
jgi:probable HAF family extracellular repeat protein